MKEILFIRYSGSFEEKVSWEFLRVRTRVEVDVGYKCVFWFSDKGFVNDDFYLWEEFFYRGVES